ERDPHFLLRPPHELAAVLRFPYRRGCHCGDPRRPAPLADLPHPGQGYERMLHGLGIEPAGGGETVRQARLLPHLINDRKAGRLGILGNEEPDRVGSDVDRGEALGRRSRHAESGLRGSPRSSAWCLIDLPSTRNTTSSPMLVARSAMRSRFRLTRKSSIPVPIVLGSSIMWVRRIRNTERCRASTLSSCRQTSRPAPASPRINASSASESLSRASRAISTSSGSGVIGRDSARR